MGGVGFGVWVGRAHGAEGGFVGGAIGGGAEVVGWRGVWVAVAVVDDGPLAGGREGDAGAGDSRPLGNVVGGGGEIIMARAKMAYPDLWGRQAGSTMVGSSRGQKISLFCISRGEKDWKLARQPSMLWS